VLSNEDAHTVDLRNARGESRNTEKIIPQGLKPNPFSLTFSARRQRLRKNPSPFFRVELIAALDGGIRFASGAMRRVRFVLVNYIYNV
jgi:hypothetical protein